jgi:predicted permease
LALLFDGRAPLPIQFQLNWRLFLFTAGVSLIIGLIFGIVPVLSMNRLEPLAEIRGITARLGRGKFGSLKLLVSAEIAMCIPLVFVAGLLARTLWNLRGADLGLTRSNMLMLWVDPAGSPYKRASLIDVYEGLFGRLKSIPGVENVTMSDIGMFSGGGTRDFVAVLGRDAEAGEKPQASLLQVGPEFFAVMGTPVLQGRDVSQFDRQNTAKVAWINESATRYFFSKENPLGQRIRLGEEDTPLEIVGLVQDSKFNSVRESPSPTVYIPFSQAPVRYMTFEIRVEPQRWRASADLNRTIRQEVSRQAPGLPVVELRSLDDWVARSFWKEEIMAQFGYVFGPIALILACLGLYGITIRAVGVNRKDIGIRIALGANAFDVVQFLIRDALAMVPLGILVGILCSAAAVRLVSDQLFAVDATDSVVDACSILLLMLAGGAGMWFPARRAMRLYPADVLRQD